MAAIPLIDGTCGARLPLKLSVGAPCNGCGLCCAAEPCGIAREFIGAGVEGPCLALEFGEGRFWCGMVRRPDHYLELPHTWADETIGATIAGMLGAGRGCDADDA